jgi:hypothetical protein
MTLGQRLQTQETTKRMIFLLAARAETIAAQAWDLNARKSRDVERAAQDLVSQLHEFAKSFTVLSDRVADDMATGQQLAKDMLAHAQLLLKTGRAAEARGERSGVLAQLQPLAMNLTALANRQRGDTVVAQETVGLAERATQLADQAQTMTTPAGIRGAGRTAVDLHRALRGIADDAGAVSLRISSEAALLKAAVTEMATSTQQLAAGRAPRTAFTQDEIAVDRIRRMVRKGFGAAD